MHCVCVRLLVLWYKRASVLTFGIDPGLSGALVVAVDGEPIAAYRVPTCVVPGGKSGTKREYDVGGMLQTLKDAAREPWRKGFGEYEKPDLVVIERTQGGGGGMAKGGLASHSLGLSRGLWQGLIVALGWRSMTVRPHIWQRKMLKGTPGARRGTDTKDRAILACGFLFPEWVSNGGLRPTERSRKPDHNIADAALLAAYAQMLQRDDEE